MDLIALIESLPEKSQETLRLVLESGQLQEFLTLKEELIGPFFKEDESLLESLERANNLKRLTPEEKEFILKPISDLNLSKRTCALLKRVDIITLKDLLRWETKHLWGIHGFGSASFDEAVNLVHGNHLSFGIKY